MLKIIFVLFILLPCNSISQSIAGLSAGYYRANFYDRSSNAHYSGHYNSSNSFCISAFYQEQKVSNINLASEIAYVQKPLDVKATFGGLGYQSAINTHYNLTFIYISAFPNITLIKQYLYLGIGPTFGFQTKSFDDFPKPDIRVHANLGLFIPLFDKIRLAFDSSYSVGLNSISSGGKLESINSRDISLKIGIGYSFPNFHLSNNHRQKASH